MSQAGDYTLSNIGFSAFRSELNTILGAINTLNAGSSAPGSIAAGSLWLDTTNSTTPTLKFYDGSDQISLCTFNYSANTVNWLDSTVSADLSGDSTPQLGGMLDVNGNHIGDGTLELLKFSETGSAVNEFTIANAAAGAGPTLSASGTETNVDINITPKGTGDVVLAGDTVSLGDSGAAATLRSNGAGTLTVTTGGATDLILSTNNGTTSGTITITDAANGAINLTPNGTGNVQLYADEVTIGDSGATATLSSNGTGNLLLNTNSGTNSSAIEITDAANGNIDFTTNGTGAIKFNDLAYVPQQAITSSSNAVAWDAQAKSNAYHLTTENTTLSAPSNAVEGSFICIEINFDGSHTFSWNAIFNFAADTPPTTTDTNAKTDIFVFKYNGAIWQEVGRTLNIPES